MTNIIPLGSIPPVWVLGLDQDSNNIGWAIGHGPDYQSSGLQTFTGSRTQRLGAIYRWLKGVLIEWRPEFYVLETPMGDHENLDTHRILGQVLGICKAAGFETITDFFVVTPYQIKQTGYYKEEPRGAALLAGKPEVSGHEADAIGAWLAGWQQYRTLEIEKRLVNHGSRKKRG